MPKKVRKRECAIVNLDDKLGQGTHWVAYVKNNNKVIYFDCFGNVKQCQELINYYGSDVQIQYNRERYQNFNEENCGQWCLRFLHYINKIN